MQENHQKETQIYKEENRTIIRVWATILSGGKNVGHVSIETKYAYYSLWPTYQGKQNADSLALFHPVEHQFKNFQQDCKSEGRIPDAVICLYTLDTENIHKRFNEIKSKLKGWSLIGETALIRNDGDADSCATFAYKLLREGGIYDLISNSHLLKHSSIVTPDNLLNSVRTARKVEYEMHEYIKNYIFSDETTENYLDNANVRKCNLY